MRKNLLFAGLALALASLAASSCAKIIEKEANPGESAGKKVTLYVQDNEWLPEEGVRSSYNPSTGIQLSGSETIALYYYQNSKYNGSEGNYSVKATPSGGGVYSFTAPGEAESTSWWYSMMPYSRTTKRTGPTSDPKYTYGMSYVGPVQYPGTDTFDPQADLLLGKPFQIEGGTGTITAFKRMLAPLRLLITGLANDEKIYAATVSLSGTPSTKTNCLSGSFQINFSDSYGSAEWRGINNASRSRKITAYYGNGLTKQGDGWPVWLMVNPITIESGTSLTLTVTTANKIYTRTAPFTKNETLSSEQINKLTFRIDGDGASSEDNILVQDFTSPSLTAGTNLLTASNGGTLTWSFQGTPQWSASVNDNGSLMPNALSIQENGSFTIPTIGSNVVTKVRFLMHPCSNVTSSGITFTLKDGIALNSVNASLSSTGAATYDGGYASGGYVDIDLPDGYSSLSGLTILSSKTVVVSAIIFKLASAPAAITDYYSEFISGTKLRIGSSVYDKDNNSYALVKLNSTTSSDLATTLSSNDIVFLDYDAGDAEPDQLTIPDSYTISNAVLIGRYPDHQPKFTFDGKVLIGGSASFKNVEMVYKNHTFQPSSTADASLSIEDCYITAGASNKALFYDQNPTYCFANLYLKNSVVIMNNSSFGLFYLSGGKKTVAEQTTVGSYLINNNVFHNLGTGPGTGSGAVFLLTASSTEKEKGKAISVATPNLNLSFTNNTINSWNGRVISLRKANNVHCDNNVCQGALAENKDYLYISSSVGNIKVANSSLCNNWISKTGEGAYSWTESNYSASFTQQGSIIGTLSDPFTASANASIGYLPINTSVVTNGAGATYDTKLWRSWP